MFYSYDRETTVLSVTVRWHWGQRSRVLIGRTGSVCDQMPANTDT